MLLLLHIVFSIGSIVWMIAGRLDLWDSLFHRFIGASTSVYLVRASHASAFYVPRPPLIWIAFTSIEATESPVLVFGFEIRIRCFRGWFYSGVFRRVDRLHRLDCFVFRIVVL